MPCLDWLSKHLHIAALHDGCPIMTGTAPKWSAGSSTSMTRSTHRHEHRLCCTAGADWDPSRGMLIHDGYTCWRRVAGQHEAEELLLRTVAAPLAERCLAHGGVDEPGFRGSIASTPDADGAGNRQVAQDRWDELVVIAARAASGYLQVCQKSSNLYSETGAGPLGSARFRVISAHVPADKRLTKTCDFWTGPPVELLRSRKECRRSCCCAGHCCGSRLSSRLLVETEICNGQGGNNI